MVQGRRGGRLAHEEADRPDRSGTARATGHGGESPQQLPIEGVPGADSVVAMVGVVLGGTHPLGRFRSLDSVVLRVPLTFVVSDHVAFQLTLIVERRRGAASSEP